MFYINFLFPLKMTGLFFNISPIASERSHFVIADLFCLYYSANCLYLIEKNDHRFFQHETKPNKNPETRHRIQQPTVFVKFFKKKLTYLVTLF